MDESKGSMRSKTILLLATTTLSINLSLAYLLSAYQETYARIWSSATVLAFVVYFHVCSIAALVGTIGVLRKHVQTTAWFMYFLLLDVVVGWGVRFCVLDAFLGGSGLWTTELVTYGLNESSEVQTALGRRRVDVQRLVPLLVVVLGSAVLQASLSIGARRREREDRVEEMVEEERYRDVV